MIDGGAAEKGREGGAKGLDGEVPPQEALQGGASPRLPRLLIPGEVGFFAPVDVPLETGAVFGRVEGPRAGDHWRKSGLG